MLPRQLSYGNVDHQVSKGEEIVPAAQLVAQVGIDGDEASCADQVFSRPEIDMLSRNLSATIVISPWLCVSTHYRLD